MKTITSIIFAIALLPLAAFAATIEQASVRDGDTFKPAVRVDGAVYETPYRLSAAEAEAWVAANVALIAKASNVKNVFTYSDEDNPVNP